MWGSLKSPLYINLRVNNAFTFCSSTHNMLGFDEVKSQSFPQLYLQGLCASSLHLAIHDLVLFVKQISCLSWLVCSFQLWTSRSYASVNATTFLLMAYVNLDIVIFENTYKFWMNQHSKNIS